jgi:hypothetical protein
MENILNIVIPLILTGLGFITYRHPDISRKLLRILLYSTIIIFIISSIYYFGRSSQFYDIRLNYTPENTEIGKIFDSQKEFNNTLLNRIFTYSGLTVFVIAIFYFLSGMFDKVRNPESENHNDSSPKTAL